MNYANDLYQEVRALLTTNEGLIIKYRRLGRLLDRVLKERTEGDSIAYHGLIPRIYLLCKRYDLDHKPLCILYGNIRKANEGSFLPEQEDFLYDAKALCQAIAEFYNEPIPLSIAEILPKKWRVWESKALETGQHLRLTVSEWDENTIQGFDEYGEKQVVKYGSEWSLNEQIYPFATLNLLDISINEDKQLCPKFIILEPDYLIDITAVCQCVKDYGNSPLHYLMNKFQPREDTLAIQLGNAANQFLDDAVRSEDSFLDSMRKSFQDYALNYCTLEGIDEKFFAQCREQHKNINRVVKDIFPQTGINVIEDGALLEPNFFCPLLGLQGRMDLLTRNEDTIVELKGGKRDEFHNTFKLEHAWQMALYKELLHYNLGKSRSQIRTLLLYSRYPQIYDIRLGQQAIVEALNMRNGIVHVDRMLRENPKEFLLSLKEEDFNPLHSTGKLYQDFIRPRVQEFLSTLQGASPLAFDYFCTMVAFLEREQFHAKVGENRPDSDRGFAQAWLCDDETKLIQGNIITDLHLQPIVNERGMLTHIEAHFEPDNQGQPNFRENDSVLLYERESEGDNITNRRSIRCQVETLMPDTLLLRLIFPQRDVSFIKEDGLYAIESSHSDGIFAQQYSGLYAYLASGQSPMSPPIDVKLLIGPPGSGKTSVALRKMVEEGLEGEGNMLLMAYTNRAVDEICKMLESLPGSPDYVRIGQETSCEKPYRHRLLRNLIADCANRKQVLERLQPIRLVCGTVTSLAGATNLRKLKNFRTAYLDEASQVLEPQLLPLLDASPRWVMIGDQKQLPAVVVQPSSVSEVKSELLREIGLTDCRNSFFERLHTLIREGKIEGEEEMLERQGRMHSEINAFVANRYYEDRLQVVPLPHQTQPLPWKVSSDADPLLTYLATHRMGCFNVTKDYTIGNNKINQPEAQTIASIVQCFYDLHQQAGQPWTPDSAIGIIVPFRGQIAQIRQELARLDIPQYESITIDTVERYQGSQRDIILFSTVVSQPYQVSILSAPVVTDGSPIDRKLNVAVTRARNQFFLVGNLALLSQAEDYRVLIDYMKAYNSD